jgi:hypothetical protein
MMRLILLLNLIFTTSWVLAQDVVFNNVYDFGTLEADAGIVLGDSCYFVTAGGPINNTYTAIIGKLGLDGNELNSVTFSIDSFGASVGRGKSIEFANGQTKVVGFFNDTVTTRPFILVLDNNLNMVWIDTFLIKASNYAVVSDYNQNTLTCGWFGETTGDQQFYLSKYSQNGVRIFQKKYGNANTNEKAYSISQAPDGGYVLSGYRVNGNSDSNPYLIKTDSNGVLEWDKEFELSDWSEPAAINQIDSLGNIYVGSAKVTVKKNNGSIFLVSWLSKLNSLGNTIWERTFTNVSKSNSCVGLVQRRNGNILMLVQSQPDNDSLGKFIGRIYEVDTAGKLIKNITVEYNPALNPLGFDYPRSIDTTADNGFVIAGFATQLPTGQDLWVVKFDSNGCYDYSNNSCIVGVSELSDANFQLSVWPNPAKDVLNIETDSPMEEIRVFNQLGSLVFSFQLSAFSSFSPIDISNFKPGLYFLVVKTEKGVETKKFIKHE